MDFLATADVIFYLITFMGIGATAFWLTTVKGQYFVISKLLKKPAKILVTYHAGHLLDMRVVTPKTNSLRQGDHTILPNWFSADAPVWRQIGSTAQYIFNFKGSAELFDPENVEFGVYEHTQESIAYLKKAESINKENEVLRSDYEKAYSERRDEDAAKIAANIEENNTKILAWVEKSKQVREFKRVVSNPLMVTAILDTERNLLLSKIMKGFLGQLERYVKTAVILLALAMVGAILAAILSGYIAFVKLH